MAAAIFWNRRKGADRRYHEEHRFTNRREEQRRNSNSDNYVIVMGKGGIDRFTLLVALPLLALLLLLVYALEPFG